MMSPTPPFNGDGFLQTLFHTVGCRPDSQLHAIGNTKHMGIHSNSRRIVKNADKYIRRLTSYTGKFHQFIKGLRHFPLILFT